MAPDANHLLRGVCVGALSTLVTAAAHRAGGGALPSETGALLLLVVCAALGCVAASMRGISRLRLMGALATAQALGHLALSAMDTHPHGATMDGRMLWAHLMAIVAGAYLIDAAERGSRWAASTLRRIARRPVPLPIDRTLYVPVPGYLHVCPPQCFVLSGTGTRGPPTAT